MIDGDVVLILWCCWCGDVFMVWWLCVEVLLSVTLIVNCERYGLKLR